MWRTLDPWRPVSSLGLAAATGALAALVLLLLTAPDGYVRVLDDANLVFHEAGHPIFAVLGWTMGMLGGTLGQLLVPAAAAIAFWRRREPLSVAIALFWLFENFFSIARYMADARALVLPLVGGGIHDWNVLFARWGVLRENLHIAAAVRMLGGCGLLATWSWIAWRWWGDRAAAPRQLSAAPLPFAPPRTPPAPAPRWSGTPDARSPRKAADSASPGYRSSDAGRCS